jgi:hypothetical protein
VRSNQSEGTLLGGKRRAVHGICHDRFRFENPRIQLRQGEDHTITVFRLGDDLGSQRGAAKLFPAGNSTSAKEFFNEHTLIRFRLFVVRIRYRERFPRHLFQISNS